MGAAEALWNAGICLANLPTPGRIECEIAGGPRGGRPWVLDMLLAPSPAEVTFSNISFEDLKAFSQSFPELAGAVRLKIYLSPGN